MQGGAPEAGGRAPRVAVCVVTRCRPQALLRLLGALEGQEPPGIEMRVVVVDNDDAQSARPVCDALAARVSYPLRYAVEKRRGIPQARNRAVSLALRDDFVAFVDDDELPEPGWLAELLRVQRETGAAAVTGPCLPRFGPGAPAWVVQGGFFQRPRFATGSERDAAFTHNVLISTEALGAMPRLFDEEMSLSGGSDVEFFRRFTGAGQRIVWADGARVVDVVPASRATLRWILRRARRVGASNAWVELRHSPGGRSALRVLFHAGRCLAKAALLLAASGVGGRAAAARALQLACFGVGRAQGVFGRRVDEYADRA